ncbi:MAG: ATP phosphoribosyltransferase [Cyanobacteria bacterium]|nr:ATP phosphoribosyltransferase [Cyanobacteriota bacterium]
MSNTPNKTLKLTLPKGRIQEKVLKTLEQIGLRFSVDSRSYRPICSDTSIEVKMLKPQNIPSLVALGRHDFGFAGGDWVIEQKADVVEWMDLGFDPVQIVAAVPESMVEGELWRKKQIVVASEYRNLTLNFIEKHKLNAVFIQTYGATEALPPEDADLIVDNTATGTTLKQNRLTIVEELMRSTTRMICNKQTLEDPWKRQKLEELKMLINSTLQAQEKVLLEMNVSKEDFEKVIAILPCMKSPTVSPLYKEDGYAVKVAVTQKEVPALIPTLYAAGARDILEYRLQKIVS